MIVSKAFDNFILQKRVQGLSEKTLLCYRNFVSPFIAFLGHTMDIETITKECVYNYILCLEGKKLSKATLATYIRHIKIFLVWIENEYEISLGTHKIKIPRSPKKVLHIYDDDEIRSIFSTVKSDIEWISARNRAIIALMLDSGLRQKEVCTLLRKDVSYNSNTIKVSGKGNKERIVPLGRLSRSFLQRYDALCPYHEETFFVARYGGVMSCDSVKHFMHKISLQLPFEFSSHKLRHNFATNYCLDQYEKYGQVDIYRLMVLMGHEDVETTRRYLHFANQLIASKNNISHLDKVLLASD